MTILRGLIEKTVIQPETKIQRIDPYSERGAILSLYGKQVMPRGWHGLEANHAGREGRAFRNACLWLAGLGILGRAALSRNTSGPKIAPETSGLPDPASDRQFIIP
ncbi:hypothetical protein EQ718_17010 (plasmid) [Paracoccus versutus]|uniref:hypothetical protein n=1 Tax=Paracoccus versutus TaxID=34007 RepID=UPI0011C03A68|nr:hypothetical protein [Paracoccus versutus]WEJ80575.1 hypothetical protein EQ718_17010 [Paracoccus versutus]